MKKFILISVTGILLAGCSVSQFHNIDEEGYVRFVHKTDYSEDLKEQENPEEQIAKIPEYCEKVLNSWGEEITEKECLGDDNGIITMSGRYKIEGNNFIKKNGYILYNAKELNHAKTILSENKKEYSPSQGDADKSAKSGVRDVYEFVLPGEPVNYVAGKKINSFMLFNDKDYFFISKIEEGENPFKEKMTTDNNKNIESLYYFPEIATEKEAINNIGDTLVRNAQKTETPLITNIPKKEEKITKKVAINQKLPSTGGESIVKNVLDSVLNFFRNLF